MHDHHSLHQHKDSNTLVNKVFLFIIPTSSLRLSFKYKHLWIKKSTGLGITKFFLRIMAWLRVKEDKFRNSHMCIITGPNIDMVTRIINRTKCMFEYNEM